MVAVSVDCAAKLERELDMGAREVVMAFYEALSTSGPEAAAGYLADDLTVEQPTAPV